MFSRFLGRRTPEKDEERLIITVSDSPNFKYPYLTANVAASGTSIAVNRLQTGLIAGGFWVIIDPWTVQCEIRKVTAISGNTLTVAALTYAHSADDAVIYTTQPDCNVKYWGALGDNSHDDSAEIQAAIDAAIDMGNPARVVFPPGNYKVTTSLKAGYDAGAGITDKNGLLIEGQTNYRECRITFTGSGYALDCSGSGLDSDDPVTRFEIRNLQFYGDGNSTPTGGIDIRRTFLVNIVKCSVSGFYNTGAVLINATNSWGITVDRCHLSGGLTTTPYGKAGIRVGSPNEGAGQGSWSQSIVHIKDTVIQKMAMNGIRLTTDHDDTLDSFVVESCLFGSNQKGHIYFADGGQSGFRVTSIEIRNSHFEICGFDGTSVLEMQPGVYIQSANSVVLDNNYVNAAYIGFHLRDCGRFLITPSTFVTVSTYQGQMSDQSVSSITRSGSTATVTTSSAHNYETGQHVKVEGANQSEYNGVWDITVATATTFTYTVPGTPATPATGTITCNCSFAYKVTCPNTISKGVMHPQSLYATQVGTELHTDTNEMYISWAGLKAVTTNAQWTEEVARIENAFQGTFILRRDPNTTGRDYDQYLSLYAIPDGTNKLFVPVSPARIIWASQDPASAASSDTFAQGDLCFDTTPSVGNQLGWVCTSGGSPGTWKPFGVVDLEDWTDYSSTSTIVGWSSYTTQEIWYRVIGDFCFVRFLLNGTSDSTTTTFTLPYNNSADLNVREIIRITDSGSAAVGMLQVNTSSGTVTFYPDLSFSSTWTASGSKSVAGSFFYKMV